MKKLKVSFQSIAGLVWLMFVLGCQPVTTIRNSASYSSEKEGVQPSPEKELVSQQFLKARQVLDGRCLGCHASGTFSWNIQAGSSESVWIDSSPQGLIVPGDAQASRLVKYMIYSPNGIMPYLGMTGPKATTEQFSRESYDAIVDWINSLDKNEYVGTLKAGKILMPNEYQKLGDRRYVYKIFREIFGPYADPNARNLIHNKLLPFGGPCNSGMGVSTSNSQYCFHVDVPMDHVGSLAPNGFIDPKHYDTVDMATAGAATNPDSSPVREAYRTYTCEKMLLAPSHSSTYAGPLYHALQVINDDKSLYEGASPAALNFSAYPAQGSVPSVAEIRAAYRLFNNYREPSEQVIAALEKVGREAQEKIVTPANGFPVRFEPWRYILLTMCLAPETQIQ